MNKPWFTTILREGKSLTSLLKRRVVILLLSFPCLVSCSILQVGYSQLDRIFLWKLDRYFDLSGAQKKFAAEELEGLHAWHRQEELPRYTQFLEHVDRYVQDGLNPSEVESLMVSIDTFRARLARQVAPSGARLFSTLTLGQIHHFQRELEEDNAELESEFGPDDTQREQDRTDSILKRLTAWVGELSEDQKNDIRGWIHVFPDTTTEWLAHRRNRQAILVGLLISTHDPQALEPDLYRWLASSKYGATGEYITAWKNWRNGIQELVLNIDEILTLEQRAHFSDELRELIHDLQKLG